MIKNFQISDIYSDGMVLQRDQAIVLSGAAADGDAVEARLSDEVAVEAIAADGRFRLRLPSHAAARGLTLTFTVNGAVAAVIRDVAIGEVWLCAGQSNMNLALRYDGDYQANAPAVLDGLASQDIHYFEVPKAFTAEAAAASTGHWSRLTADAAPDVSAIGYYYSRQLASRFPELAVAFVWLAVDGTTASAWTSERALSRDPELRQLYLDSYRDLLDARPDGLYEDYLATAAAQSQIPGVGDFWERVYAGKVPHNELVSAYKTRHELFLDGMLGPQSENRPHALYDHMVAPIVGYGCRGMLWYQGESDDAKAYAYDRLLTALINDWRERWGWAFPVILMQIAPFEDWFGPNNGLHFPMVRARQAAVAARLPEVYLTNVMDAGARYDIHPKAKRTAADRFYQAALTAVYGLATGGLAPQLLVSAATASAVTLRFDQDLTGDLSGLPAVATLTVNGRDEAFTARLDGCQLTLQPPGRLQPRDSIAIGYQQAPYSSAVLFNQADIPVTPFISYVTVNAKKL